MTKQKGTKNQKEIQEKILREHLKLIIRNVNICLRWMDELFDKNDDTDT